MLNFSNIHVEIYPLLEDSKINRFKHLKSMTNMMKIIQPLKIHAAVVACVNVSSKWRHLYLRFCGLMSQKLIKLVFFKIN